MWEENPFKCNILFGPPCYICWGPESQNMGSSWLAVKGDMSALFCPWAATMPYYMY